MIYKLDSNYISIYRVNKGDLWVCVYVSFLLQHGILLTVFAYVPKKGLYLYVLRILNSSNSHSSSSGTVQCQSLDEVRKKLLTEAL